MARLQILELPEGSGDDRPPFVLVIDQAPHGGALSRSFRVDTATNAALADRIGARGVLVFEDTVEIPANEVADVFRTEVRESVGEMYEAARRSLVVGADPIVPSEGGHRFVAVPGPGRSPRCSVCGITRFDWATREDVPPTCNEAATRSG